MPCTRSHDGNDARVIHALILPRMRACWNSKHRDDHNNNNKEERILKSSAVENPFLFFDSIQFIETRNTSVDKYVARK